MKLLDRLVYILNHLIQILRKTSGGLNGFAKLWVELSDAKRVICYLFICDGTILDFLGSYRIGRQLGVVDAAIYYLRSIDCIVGKFVLGDRLSCYLFCCYRLVGKMLGLQGCLTDYSTINRLVSQLCIGDCFLLHLLCSNGFVGNLRSSELVGLVDLLVKKLLGGFTRTLILDISSVCQGLVGCSTYERVVINGFFCHIILILRYIYILLLSTHLSNNSRCRLPWWSRGMR